MLLHYLTSLRYVQVGCSDIILRQKNVSWQYVRDHHVVGLGVVRKSKKSQIWLINPNSMTWHGAEFYQGPRLGRSYHYPNLIYMFTDHYLGIRHRFSYHHHHHHHHRHHHHHHHKTTTMMTSFIFAGEQPSRAWGEVTETSSLTYGEIKINYQYHVQINHHMVRLKSIINIMLRSIIIW